MKINTKLLIAFALTVQSAAAASFNILYDGTNSGSIDSTIVGTGTFSYDGPITAGDFLLSDLTNVSYSATFGGSFSFDLTDLTTAPSNVGISVFELPSGNFELIFTGDSGSFSGSLDLLRNSNHLSHQPSTAPGDMPPKLYFANIPSIGLNTLGDYAATSSSSVPDSATTGLLLGLSLISLAGLKRKLS